MINPANSVTHLILCRDQKELAVGSGVLYERNKKIYVITAWHNITGRHSETLECLSRTAALPNNVLISIARKIYDENYTGYNRIWMTVPLEIDGKATYYVHPQGWPRVDVVAIPIDLQTPYISEYKDYSGNPVNFCLPLLSSSQDGAPATSIQPIQEAEPEITFPCEDFSKYLYASEDLFILGYPKGITDFTGQPVWKRASVASEPHLGWNKQPLFLVDCASKEGMSGAPVIFHKHEGSIQLSNITYKTSGQATVFHGIYVGRLGSTSEFEAQVGCVWKRSVIDEIIDSGEFGAISEEICIPDSDITQHIERQWPQNEKYAEFILDDKCSHINFLMHSVMQAINGRANPNYVRKLIIEYATRLIESTTLQKKR